MFVLQVEEIQKSTGNLESPILLYSHAIWMLPILNCSVAVITGKMRSECKEWTKWPKASFHIPSRRQYCKISNTDIMAFSIANILQGNTNAMPQKSQIWAICWIEYKLLYNSMIIQNRRLNFNNCWVEI